MIERLGSLLADLCPTEQPPTPREVAELIWLARHLPEEAEGTEPATGRPEERPAPPGMEDGHEPEPSETGDDHRSESEATRLYLPGPSSADGGEEAEVEPATPIRVTGPPTLPRRRELGRALRPLKRRVPSRVRTVLDEDASVSRIADHDHWIPVLTPAADRWLDVLIVLDTYGESATFWEPLARELSTLLLQLGAFRDVRLHHLAPRSDGDPGLGAGTGAATSSQPLRSTGSAVDPTGRTVTLVLTDGVAPAWRTGPMLQALRKWADHGPTAILQTLPENVWERTALAPEPGRFRTREAGGPNSRLLYTGYGLRPPAVQHHVPVPVLGLTPEWLGPWAHAIAQPAAFDGAALLLPAPGGSPYRRLDAPLDVEGLDRSITFEDFRAQAQPDVFRLAAYLAAAPLNLGVMRTVQSAMLPASPVSDLAEIVYSGLLRKVNGGGGRPDDALNQAFEFVPGVRERLLSTIRRDEADEVIAAVSAYVDRHTPMTGARFTAAVRDPDGALALPLGARHWAEVHHLVRRRQGRRMTTADRVPTAADLMPGPSVQRTEHLSVPSAPDPGVRRFLITIGVSRHEDPSLSDLPGVRRDIARVHDLFEGLGYTHVLLGLAADPRRAELVQGLREWAADALLGPTDVVVVYFAGSAWNVHGQLRLLAADSVLDDVTTALLPEVAFEGLLRSEVGHLLFLLDTCFGEPGPAGDASSRLFRAPRSAGAVSVLSATVSYGSEEGSWYTEALSDALAALALDGTSRFIGLNDVRRKMSEFHASRDSRQRGQVILAMSDASAEQPFFLNLERYDVFVSYAHQDGEWPVVLAENLQRLGLRVWLDQWEMTPGQNVLARLQDGLARASALVAVVSPSWLTSQWATKEFEMAAKAATDGRMPVIPVLWGDVTTLPPSIAERAYVDFRTVTTRDEYEAKLRELVHGIRTLQGPEPPAASRAASSWLGRALDDSRTRAGRRDKFTLFGYPTDCHIYEGDGTRPIKEENVRIHYTPERVTFPEEIAGWRLAIEDEERRKEAAGRPYSWNSRRFAVEGLTVSRTRTSESPIVTLSLRDADYFDFLTTSLNLDRPQTNGLTLRQQYLENQDPVEAPSFMYCSFGVHVTVRTRPDGKMLFSHRSAKVAGPNRSRWNTSAGAGMAVNDDLGPDARISLHAVARRALREQLAIQATDSLDLELLGFGLDLQNNQWAAFFTAELHDLDEPTLRRRWARGIEDKWVHDEYAFVPADPDSVLSFLLNKPVDTWTSCAPAVYYLTLVHAAVRGRNGDPAGRSDVDAAERRVLNRVAGTDD